MNGILEPKCHPQHKPELPRKFLQSNDSLLGGLQGLLASGLSQSAVILESLR